MVFWVNKYVPTFLLKYVFSPDKDNLTTYSSLSLRYLIYSMLSSNVNVSYIGVDLVILDSSPSDSDSVSVQLTYPSEISYSTLSMANLLSIISAEI